ncbi:hypothetical protein BX589_10195 [Paraburkholderia fungorum]|uniref:hypothetical protein n=1 Tax=Paraburkholderia fungorum TaxID=134537 RepID=UPI000D063814|nr:hypothetical protein [Paraburkholderia fungorum]PRZ56445.1 hypothetical protein BX589_10195 [Paraburkholderia fungorum]
MITITHTPSISSLAKVGILAGHSIGQILASIQAVHNIAAIEEETEQVSVSCKDGGAYATHYADRDFALYVWLRDTALGQTDLVLEMSDNSDSFSAAGTDRVSVSIAEMGDQRFYNFGDGFTCCIEDFFGDLSWYDEDWVWLPDGEVNAFGHETWSMFGDLEEAQF